MTSHDEDRTTTERRARELFDASVESLDARSRSRLAAARRAAVDAVRRPGRPAWNRWAPATALASAAIVAVLLLWRAPGPGSSVTADSAQPETPLEPVELLAAGEDLDLVENDLAFYDWLDATEFDVAGSTG